MKKKNDDNVYDDSIEVFEKIDTCLDKIDGLKANLKEICEGEKDDKQTEERRRKNLIAKRGE